MHRGLWWLLAPPSRAFHGHVSSQNGGVHNLDILKPEYYSNIEVINSVDFPRFPFDFATLNLRFFSFSFQINATGDATDATNAIAWVITTLSKLDVTSNMEVIIINGDLTSIDTYSTLRNMTESICGRNEWDALDSILDDCHKHQKLRRVTFGVTYRRDVLHESNGGVDGGGCPNGG
jgi:hypothetical protein